MTIRLKPGRTRSQGRDTYGVPTLSPTLSGYVESLIDELGGELLDREIFGTLMEAKVLVEQWRCHYSPVRPHSALGHGPPHRRRSGQQGLAPVLSGSLCWPGED